MRDFSEDIEKAVDLLLRVTEHQSKKKKLLDKGKIVYLQIVLFKIPFGAPRKRKFLKLCHSLYGNDPEICLFVPNRKTGVNYKKTTDELIDFCVDYYTELLEKHKVKGITTVMPLKQLKSEYGTYDLRRKLVHRFDLFLCKNSLLFNPRFLTSLGKIFRVAKKEPLGVPFPKSDVEFDPEFQKNIDRAIYTSSFFINRFSDNYSIPFGCLSNTKAELKENLEAVLKQIFTEGIIPGGFNNIRAMNLWPSQSKPIPFYVSTELPLNMKTPHVKSIRKKRSRGIEGEISTQPHKKVFVMPNGDVFVTKIKKKSPKPEFSESEGEDSFVDESNDEEMEENKKQDIRPKVGVAESEEESESEDDEEIEKKEARLMEGKMLGEEYFRTQLQEIPSQESEEDAIKNNKNTIVRLSPKGKPKSAQNGGNRSSNQKTKPKKNKLKDAVQNKGNFNKAKRKMLVKQKP